MHTHTYIHTYIHKYIHTQLDRGFSDHAKVDLVLSGTNWDDFQRAQVMADIALTLQIPRECISVGSAVQIASGVHVCIVLRSDTKTAAGCGDIAAELVKQAADG